MNRSGLTLPEVVLAIGLLLAVLLAVTQLLSSSLMIARGADRCSRACLLAENVLADLRSWAQQPANFEGDWGAWDGRTVSDPDFPGLQARVTVEQDGRPLFAPCSTVEAQEAEPIVLSRTVIPVQVEVPWDPVRSVRLVTYIDEPARNPATIEITRSGAADPMAPRQTTTLTARMLDGSGRPIPDATFDWSALPITGNGSFVSRPRDGKSIDYKHEFIPALGPPQLVPGTVELEVRGRYRSQPLDAKVRLVLQ